MIRRQVREGEPKSYEQELREQMEHKKMLEDERRRREREEEERIERRTREQQERIKREFDEEMALKRAKEEAVSEIFCWWLQGIWIWNLGQIKTML